MGIYFSDVRTCTCHAQECVIKVNYIRIPWYIDIRTQKNFHTKHTKKRSLTHSTCANKWYVRTGIELR